MQRLLAGGLLEALLQRSVKPRVGEVTDDSLFGEMGVSSSQTWKYSNVLAHLWDPEKTSGQDAVSVLPGVALTVLLARSPRGGIKNKVSPHLSWMPTPSAGTHLHTRASGSLLFIMSGEQCHPTRPVINDNVGTRGNLLTC